MTSIADSSAAKLVDRILPQHQAALTLLQSRLSVPGTRRLSWLDLACGRGQIIASLDRNLSLQARAKIEYWGYDLNHSYARETSRSSELLGFASVDTRVGDLSQFNNILPANKTFDFITLTNTVHEIEPRRLAMLLAHCLERLSPNGTLFVYDMERIKPPELGAVPWSREDIRKIVVRLLDNLGATTYRPEVGLWNHTTCNGWNVQLERQHLGVSPSDISERISRAIETTRDEIVSLLRERLVACRSSLETLTTYGAETMEEQDDKERLLFEFWSISRALEHGT